MWRYDTKCKNMFMFFLKNLARKGLNSKSGKWKVLDTWNPVPTWYPLWPPPLALHCRWTAPAYWPSVLPALLSECLWRLHPENEITTSLIRELNDIWIWLTSGTMKFQCKNKRPVGLYSPLIVGIVTDFVWSPSRVNTYHHYLIRTNPINWFGQ